jgi:hypothetical protein
MESASHRKGIVKPHMQLASANSELQVKHLVTANESVGRPSIQTSVTETAVEIVASLG